MKNNRSKFCEDLILVLKAIDQQVTRELQRTPQQRLELGTSKEQAYTKREQILIENIINSFGSGEIKLDGITVLLPAIVEVLKIIVEELGEKNIGKFRTSEILKQVKKSHHSITSIINLLEHNDLIQIN